MNRLRFEARLARRRLHELRCFRQLEIHELAAAITNSVIVAFGLAIIAAGAVAKTDFVYEPGFRYVLRVAVSPVSQPSADGSSLAYRLVRVVSRTRLCSTS